MTGAAVAVCCRLSATHALLLFSFRSSGVVFLLSLSAEQLEAGMSLSAGPPLPHHPNRLHTLILVLVGRLACPSPLTRSSGSVRLRPCWSNIPQLKASSPWSDIPPQGSHNKACVGQRGHLDL